MKVVAAVRELESEYEGRVRFNIVSPEETARSTAELEEYGFIALKHGLVAFDREGHAVVKIPGHQFAHPEIEAAIAKVLAED